MSECPSLWFDEIVESQSFEHDQKFVIWEDHENYIESLESQVMELTKELERIKSERDKYRETLEFYADEMSYSIDSYEGISGEMRSRVVLYGDSEERNDVYSYAGRRARSALENKDEGEIK